MWKIHRPFVVYESSPSGPHVTLCQLHDPLKSQQISLILLLLLTEMSMLARHDSLDGRHSEAAEAIE